MTTEPMPLTGIRLKRWAFAVFLYRIACRVSGRHEHLMQWDQQWKVWFCPHCGAIDEARASPDRDNPAPTT